MLENPGFTALKQKLNLKNIFEIRQIARKVGVPRPTTGKKERLVSGILDVASGKADPVDQSRFGAPPSSEEYDRNLVALVNKCRAQSLDAMQENGDRAGAVLSVASGDGEYNVVGFLDREKDKWLIRTGCALVNDVFVADRFAEKYGLRRGDKLCGTAKRVSPDSYAGLAALTSVNGTAPEALSERAVFDGLIPVYPEKRLNLSQGGVVGRILDLTCPLGAGQRALITAPHGAGKTTLLKNIAQCLIAGNADLKIIALLIDARPEEASDFSASLQGAEVISCAPQGLTAELMLEYAKRIAENGGDVALLIDGLSDYARCLELYGTPLPEAVEKVKRLFCAARKLSGGGSLTIAATLGDGDSLDRALYANLKGAANMYVTLSGSLARSRVYPSLDLQNTRTLRDEKLLSAAELKAADILRTEYAEKGTQSVISLFTDFSDNASLCEELLRKERD